MRVHFSAWASAPWTFGGDAPDVSAVPLVYRTFPTYYDAYRCAKIKAIKDNPLYHYPGSCVILDSGAHSILNSVGLGASHSGERRGKTHSVDDYVDALIAFVVENTPGIDYFIEMDVAEVYGMDKVLEWRRRYEAAGIMDRMIPAWHRTNGEADWRWMLRCPSRYVALEGLRKGRVPIEHKRMIDEAYRLGVRVHVFALGSVEKMLSYPAYSTDFTTWQAAKQYGRFPRFVKGEMFKSEWLTLGRVVRTGNTKRVHVFERLLSEPEQAMETVRYFKELERRVTMFWLQKGYDWEKVEREGEKHGE